MRKVQYRGHERRQQLIYQSLTVRAEERSSG